VGRRLPDAEPHHRQPAGSTHTDQPQDNAARAGVTSNATAANATTARGNGQVGNGAQSVAKPFTELLDAMGIKEHERISVCHKRPGQSFCATVPRTRADAVGAAASPLPAADRWFGINPLNVPDGYQGRGRTEHVTRCVNPAQRLRRERSGQAGPRCRPRRGGGAVQAVQ
jgi:hypothetical protein